MNRAHKFSSIVSALASGFALALAACNPFNPTFDNPSCGRAGECPGGLVCSEGVCVAEPIDVNRCGDGVTGDAEVCDDGNTDDGDGCDASCAAAHCYVPVTHPTVTAAVADASCPTVYVSSGTYAERLSLTRDVVIAGVGAMPVILDGGAAGTVISVETAKQVTLRQLTIRNGSAESGGGISNQGALLLDRVTVRDNIAQMRGAGIHNVGSVTLAASMVSANRVQPTTAQTVSGAGISSSGGVVRLEARSVVERNEIIFVGTIGKRAQGGGIAAVDTSVTLVEESVVRDNVLEVDTSSSGGTEDGRAEGGGVWLSGGSLTVNGSAIQGNSAITRGPFAHNIFVRTAGGGGIYAIGANVSLSASAIRGNHVVAHSAGIARAWAGGGRIEGGALVSSSTAITGNTVEVVGGDGSEQIETAADAGGLAIEGLDATLTETTLSTNIVSARTSIPAARGFASSGALDVRPGDGAPRTVSLIRCAIDGNQARSMSGGASSGGIQALSFFGQQNLTLRLDSSTVSNNIVEGTAASDSGGIRAYASTDNTRMHLSIINSTISGNEARSLASSAGYGGIRSYAGAGNARVQVELTNTTITNNRVQGNSDTRGGGLYLTRVAATATVAAVLYNNIIAGNSAPASADCIAIGATLSGGFNLIGSLADCVFPGGSPGNLTGFASLSPLADNGGPTRTHALQAGSLAIDAGNDTGCRTPSDVVLVNDQRGMPRSNGGRCDIGAYER